MWCSSLYKKERTGGKESLDHIFPINLEIISGQEIMFVQPTNGVSDGHLAFTTKSMALSIEGVCENSRHPKPQVRLGEGPNRDCCHPILEVRRIL